MADKNHFDLLWAICNQLEVSKTTWHYCHIKCLQDDLGYLENLNMEMDTATKSYWAVTIGMPTRLHASWMKNPSLFGFKADTKLSTNL
jgi:hypothetical protein